MKRSIIRISHTHTGIFIFLLAAFAFCSELHGADALIDAANKATTEYRRNLETLAVWCDENKFPNEAKVIRNCVVPKAPDKIYIPMLPLDVQPPAKKPQSETVNTQLNSRMDELSKLRKDYAKIMFAFAKTAAKQDRGSLAMQMSLAALHADPDHAQIRRVLGFTKYRNQWRTPWETEQLKKGFVDHPRFGWIPSKHVQRYEAGERYSDGKWITEAQDRQKHSGDIRNGWIIESEHYTLRTNHSIEEGVRVCRNLEHLYRAWKLLFYRFMASDVAIASMFETRSAAPKPLKKLGVYLFRDKKNYVDSLVRGEPFVIKTIGLYVSGSRKCCFFVYTPPAPGTNPGPDDDHPEDIERTVYHEATHQLFYECRTFDNPIGELRNYWIIEGIAMFMETLHEEGDYYVLGGWNDTRVKYARAKVRQNGFYISFEKLTKLGRLEFQSFPNLIELYTHCAGTAFFLMNYDDGAYRDATVMFLRLVYENNDTTKTLESLTGRTSKELDDLYKTYMSNEP